MNDNVQTVIEEVRAKAGDTTGKRYASSIRAFEDWCEDTDTDPFSATPRTIEDYLQHLHSDKDYAYDTLAVHRSALVQFYKRAKRLAEDNVVPDPREVSPLEPLRWSNPAKEMGMGDIDVKTTSTKRQDTFDNRPNDDGAALTDDEVETLANNVRAPVVRNELLVRLMYQCMLRRGEAARIKVENVDRDKREVFIPSEDSKTGDSHTAYYNRSLDRLMSLWCDADRPALADDSNPFLFVSQKGGRIADYTVSDIVRSAADEAGLQETLYTNARGYDVGRITGHSLRRAGATRRFNNGADIYTVMKLLNHDSVETTKEYLNLTDDDLADKARESWSGD